MGLDDPEVGPVDDPFLRRTFYLVQRGRVVKIPRLLLVLPDGVDHEIDDEDDH